MRDYSVARNLLGLIEFFLWMGVLAGVGIAFSSVGVASRSFGTPGFLAAIPGIAIGLLSLFGVAITQMGRATVDSAEYGQQSLKVARDQLEVSKQALKQDKAIQTSFAALLQSRAEPDMTQTSLPAASFADASKPVAELGETALPPTDDKLKVDGDTLTYKGQTGYLIDGKWNLKGIPFDKRELLVDYIDQFGVNASPKRVTKVHS